MEEIAKKIAEQVLEEVLKKVKEIERKDEYKNLLKDLFKKPLPLDRDLNIGLNKVYVEPFYKKPLERENSQSLKINLWDLLEQQKNQTKFLLVLGQPGSGKSSLVKKLASEWAEKNREPYPKEIFKYKLYVVQLRNLPKEFKEKPIEVLEKYLKSELGEAYKPYLWGEEVSYPFEGFNKSILLLDGLDEFVMNYNLSEEEVKNLLEGLRDGLKNPKCYVLITSRPNYLSKETLKDLNKRLDFKVLEIADLNEEQIKTFLENYKKALEEAIEEKRRQGDKAKNVYLDRYEELLEKINNLPQERKNLVSQPLLLYMVSSLYLQKQIEIDLQWEEIKIYQELITEFMERKWENDNHLRKVIPKDYWKELYKKFLEELAFLIEFSSKDYATLAEIEKLKSFKELKGITKKTPKELLGTLLTFFYFRGNSSDKETQTVEFIHKTFQEYLAAENIYNRLKELFENSSTDKEAIESILWNLFSKKPIQGKLNKFVEQIIEARVEKESNKVKNIFDHLLELLPDFLKRDFVLKAEDLVGEKPLDKPIFCFVNFWNLLKLIQKQKNSTEKLYSLLNEKKQEKIKEYFVRLLGLVGVLKRERSFSLELMEEDLSKTNLSSFNLSNDNLKNAVLVNTYLVRASLTKADLSSADLSGANLSLANLFGINLAKAILKGANLTKANLTASYLSGANLQNAYLRRANLRGADLQGANLQKVNLQEANLQWANLQEADLRGAIFDVEQIKKAKNWDKAIYDPEVAKKLGLENQKKEN